jgi:hypothetical protein
MWLSSEAAGIDSLTFAFETMSRHWAYVPRRRGLNERQRYAVKSSRPPRPPRPDALRIISMTLQAGEDVLVGRRLREVLSEARKAV